MKLMREILLKVQSGVSKFEPEGDSVEELGKFQLLAKRLYAAHQDGLIHEAKFIVSRMRNTHGWFKAAFVSGGLTYKGEQWLSASRKQSPLIRKWLIDNATQIIGTVIATTIAGFILFFLGLQ